MYHAPLVSHSLKEARLLLIFPSTNLYLFPYGLNVSLFPGSCHPKSLKTTVAPRDGRGDLPSFIVDPYYHMSPGSALGSFC